MTAQELRRWHIFTMRHPLPADLLDMHLSMLAAVVCNLAGNASVTPEQFSLMRDPPAGRPPPPVHANEPAMSDAERFLLAAGLR